MKRWGIPLVLLALTAAFFWRLWFAPDGFIYYANSAYSDLTITHWPNALFIRHSLATWGQVPLWGSLILSGEPFAANPLSGLWYPPDLLLLILPLAPAFNLLFILHTAWAGWGGYNLARSVGASRTGGLLAAVMLMFTPKAVAHLASGHAGLYGAWAWLVWTVWAARRLAERRRAGDVATAAVCAAMLVLADVRLGFYGGLAAGAYWAVVANGEWRTANHESRITLVRLVVVGLGAGLLAGALAAVQVVPLAAVAGRLNRGGLSLEDSGVFSLPPRYLIGLLVADHGGFQEWMTYLGVVGLVLALVGLFSWRSKERWWWLGLALLAALYSLGTYTPFYGVLYRLLPPLQWLRGPARAWFLVVLAAGVLAAQGLTALAGQSRLKRGVRRWSEPVTVALAGAALAGVGGGLMLRLPANVVIAVGLWPAAGALVALWAGGRLRGALLGYLVLALALADLWAVGFTLYRVRPAQDVLAEGRAAAAWLAGQERPFRVYSPSYSIPQHTGAVYGIESADGVDPFQLADYATFMRAATGVNPSGYSVTIPAFPQVAPGEDVRLSLRGVSPDLRQLGLLNVQYVAAAYPMEVEGLSPLGEWEGVYLYRNEFALPRAFVRAEEQESGGAGEVWGARVLEWTPNRIRVEAEGPGLLVLSEVYDPDWRAQVDGYLAEIVRVDGILRGVRLREGLHPVTFVYRPAGLMVGGVATVVGWACVIVLWIVGRVRATRR